MIELVLMVSMVALVRLVGLVPPATGGAGHRMDAAKGRFAHTAFINILLVILI